MGDTNVLFIELQASDLDAGKPFDGMAPGTFYDMWGSKVKVDSANFPDFVKNTKQAIKFTETADGELVGLPIDAYGHYDDQAAGHIIDVFQAEVSKPNGKKIPVLQFMATWTEVGVDLVTKGIRRFFSPTFDNEDHIIHGGSLTNHPASRDEKGNILLRPVALSQPMSNIYCLADEISLGAFDESAWDGPAVVAALDVPELRRVCLMDLNGYPGQDGEPVKELAKLPYKKTPDSAPNKAAVRACGSGARGLPAVKKPADVPEEFYNSRRKAAANKIISLWRAAFDGDAPGNIYDIAGKERPSQMSDNPDDGGNHMAIELTQEELDARIQANVEGQVTAALQKVLNLAPAKQEGGAADPGAVAAPEINLVSILGLEGMQADAVKSIEAKLGEHFKTIQKQAELQYLQQLARINRKRDMQELAQRLTGGTEETPVGLPVEAEKLSEALLALPESQVKFWTDFLKGVQKTGLTAFSELGHGKQTTGTHALPEEFAKQLDSGAWKLADLSSPIVAPALGDLAQYDLSKWQN